MPQPIEVRKVVLESVSDASGLTRLLDEGVVEADRVVAVIGKTEGNGGVNDYTRIIADRAFRDVLMARGTRSLEEVEQIPIVWSGGTDGVLSPHATIFATLPDGLGRAERRAAAVRRLRDERADLPRGHRPRRRWSRRSPPASASRWSRPASPTRPTSTTCRPRRPLLTLETITDAKRRGHDVWTEDTLKSMDVSNSTTALGIAVALGEIEMPTAEQIHKDLSLYSSVASCSSGVELDQAQIVVVGNVRGHGGRYQVGHSVMRDALDADGVWEAIRSAGLDAARAAARPPTSATGSSTSSASARPTRPAGSASGATSCSTTPTSTGTGRSRPASAASSRP